jgi:4-alpha-glucanotransferase
VIDAKWAMIVEAHERMPQRVRSEFVQFREEAESWLEAHSLFMALKDAHGGAAWFDWDEDLARGHPAALVAATQRLGEEISRHAFGQYVFSRQLEGLRRHAAARGVEIIGDVPLYVAMDSVEVWQRPDLFAIDRGRPLQVAGVPPDSFSPVGQVWDTPVYRWEAHGEEGFSWWVDRVGAFSRQADVLRIDHFTGFRWFYAIDAATRDVSAGEWRDGPGLALFDAVRERLGEIPMIVEDLGPLGDEVERLRLQLGHPGMRVLQEAFDEDVGDERLPQNFSENCAVYTGTHDNDTARGRLESEDEGYRRRALEYTGGSADTYAWDLVVRAWESKPVIAIAPLQDLLGLGSEARMNTPGTPSGNWQWRMPAVAADPSLAADLLELTTRTGRRI